MPSIMNQTTRIDDLVNGSFVELTFKTRSGSTTERAVFLGITGTGDDRKATFSQPTAGGRAMFEWDAYRFRGGWAYGSSAERLSLTSVL